MEEQDRYLLKINNDWFIADGLGYEPTQLDGDEAGRSDDFSMTRDVGGLNNKMYAKFNDLDKWHGRELSRLIKLIDLKECDLYWFNVKEYEWTTKHMYLTISKIDYKFIDNEPYLDNPVEVHFIQMDVDTL